ncbi:uncharacterized protein LY89DRAFT_643881 [Mollisia scopiformis]|uniref:DNA-directed RNA polymerase subunit n=1 Tax=Mollisia scopiformis TaxID=149040 RepID=A0A194XCZ5_MOLSC|nr:uncharacterized protein LY89DRAFT_643881 [Mollisia scopiformis]KUJ18029.1 hypothetical protein LY89DRAFT_643881 [Mollisia scopiformis]
MSIEKLTPSTMSPETPKHRSKADKKSKSSTHGEKKRKRDHHHDEDDPKTTKKSKKQRRDKHVSSAHSTVTQAPKTDPSLSPFHLQTSSLYLPLAPVAQKYPLEGLCAEHLSPLLLTYYPPFRGVILSYTNPRLSETAFGSSAPNPNSEEEGNGLLLHNIDEYAVSWTWLTADFLLFKPERGVELEGYVNLQNEGHLGVVCWNLFNASVARERMPADWVWKDVSEMQNKEGGGNEGYAEDGQGCWVDGNGEKVEGVVRFRVKEIESSHDRERGFLSIEGTMLGVEEERELVERERVGEGGGRDKAGRRLGGEKALGATILGVVSEESAEKENKGDGKRPRQRY